MCEDFFVWSNKANIVHNIYETVLITTKTTKIKQGLHITSKTDFTYYI